MKKIVFFAVLIVILGGCSKIGEKNHIALDGKNGEVTAVKTYFSASNKTLKIKSGKSFVLFFTSVDCKACAQAVPYMNYFDEKYSDKFEVIGVMNGDFRLDEGYEILRKKNINFKVISEVKSVEYLSRAVGGIYGVPVFYMYDKNGVMKEKILGLVPQSVLEKSIAALF